MNLGKKVCLMGRWGIQFVFFALLFLLGIPSLFGIQNYTVISGSMEPVLKVGSAVYVKKVDPKNIKTGDVITFFMDSSDIRVTHRVVENNLEKQILITKGDANLKVDQLPVKWEKVCGTVIMTVPFVGYILRFLGNWKGKAAALSFFAGMGLWAEIQEIKETGVRKK